MVATKLILYDIAGEVQSCVGALLQQLTNCNVVVGLTVLSLVLYFNIFISFQLVREEGRGLNPYI